MNEEAIQAMKQISEELFKDEEIRKNIESFLSVYKILKEQGRLDDNSIGSILNSFLANLLYQKKIMIIK